MNSGEIDLRALQQSLDALAETAQPREDCPPADQIWAAVHRELDPKALRAVIDHVAGCAVCAKAWDLAEAVRQEMDKEETPASPAPLPADPWWRRAAGMAASLLLVVVVVAGLKGPTPDPHRGGDDEIRFVAQGRTREDCFLRWEGPKGAAYAVEVTWITETERTVLLKARGLAAGTLRLAPETLRPVPADALLVWRVEATLDDRHWTATTSLELQ